MATRPADWTPLGLAADPTPGDYDSLQQVLSLLNEIAQATGTIESTLQAVLGTAVGGDFEGLTAQALQGQISTRFVHFMSAASSSFSTAYSAANTFSASLGTYQNIADTALTKAQAVTPAPPPPPPVDPLIGPVPAATPTITDPQVLAWQAQATQAGTDLTAAAVAAANAIGAVSDGVEPISGWQEFWEALGWIALLLMIPAIIFGGFFAILAFAVNMVLFIHAAVQFAEGQISFGQLLLSFLGIIAPTTEGLDLATLIPSLLRGAGDLLTDSVNFLKFGLSEFMNLTRAFSFTSFFSVDTLLAIGRFAYTGLLWTFEGIKALPTLLADGSLGLGRSLGDLLAASGRSIISDFRTGAWVRVFLPLKGSEISTVGFAGALRLGILERGFGAGADPLVNFRMLAGNGLHGADAGTKMWSLSSADFFKANPLQIRLDAPGGLNVARLNPAPLAAPHDISAMPLMNPGSTGLAHLSGPSLGTGTRLSVSSFGTDALGLRPGDMGFSTAGVGRTGFLDLGGLRFNDTALNPAASFAPLHIALDHFDTVSVANRAFGHSDAVFDLRNPVEITGVHLGTSQIVHMNDFSMVVKANNLGSESLPPARLTGVPDTGAAAAAHVDVSATATSHLSTGTDLAASTHLGTETVSGSVLTGLGAGNRVRIDLSQVPEFSRVEGTLSEVATPVGKSFSDKALSLIDDSDRAAAPKLDPEQTPSLSSVESQPIPRPAVATGSASVSAVDNAAVHAALDTTSPERAGVPGVLGLPGERVAMRWTGTKATEHEYDAPVNADSVSSPDLSKTTVPKSQPAREVDGSSPVTASVQDPQLAFDLLDHGTGASRTPPAIRPVQSRPATVHEAWLSYRKARTTVANAAQRVQSFTDRIGESSTGMSAAERQAHANLHDAVAKLNRAATDMRSFGADPIAWRAADHTQTLAWLQENPRLLGGAPTNALVRDLRAPDGADLGRAEFDPEEGTGILYLPHGREDPLVGSLQADGSLHLADAVSPLEWRSFAADGVLLTENHLLFDLDGDYVGELEVNAAGTSATMVLSDGTTHSWGFTAHTNDGFTLTDAAGTTRRLYNSDSAHVETQLDLSHADGSAFGTTIVTDLRGATPTHSVLGGGPLVLTVEHGGWRLTNQVTERWTGFNPAGQLTHEGMPIRTPAGRDLGGFTYDHTNGTGAVARPGAITRPVTVTGFTDTTIRLTDDAVPGLWHDIDQTGTVLRESHPTFSVADQVTPQGIVEINHAAGTARTTEGLDTADWAYTPNPDGSYRLTGSNRAMRDYSAADTLRQEHLPVPDGGAGVTHLTIRADYRNATYELHGTGLADGTGWARTAGPGPADFRLTPHLNAAHAHAGEYWQFDAANHLVEQRINLLDQGGARGNLYHRVDYRTDTWQTHDSTNADAAVPGTGGRALGRPDDPVLLDGRGMTVHGPEDLSAGLDPATRLANGDHGLAAGTRLNVWTDSAGARWWRETDGLGTTVGTGTRTITSRGAYDTAAAGTVVRVYRSTKDGGLLRAELDRDHWTVSARDAAGNLRNTIALDTRSPALTRLRELGVAVVEDFVIQSAAQIIASEIDDRTTGSDLTAVQAFADLFNGAVDAGLAGVTKGLSSISTRWQPDSALRNLDDGRPWDTPPLEGAWTTDFGRETWTPIPWRSTGFNVIISTLIINPLGSFIQGVGDASLWPVYADDESPLGYAGLDAMASFVTGLGKIPFDTGVAHLGGGLTRWIGRSPLGLTMVKFTAPITDFGWHLTLEIADNTLKDVFVEPTLGVDIPAIAEP